MVSYALVLTMFFLAISAYLVFKETQTHKAGTYVLSGLKNTVTVFRDEYGVPHIVSRDSDLDVFYALGFVHAQDRFWQMEFQRHVASGTLSELFGKNTISKDKYLRSWGFYYFAKQAWASYDDTTKEVIERYTQGINEFIALNHLPIQFKALGYKPKPWTVIDSICWQKMMAWSLENSWKKKLVNFNIAQKKGLSEVSVIQPPYPASAPVTMTERKTSFQQQEKVIMNTMVPIDKILPPKLTGDNVREALGFNDMPGKGSNAWVVSGKWTASHKPIVSNDIHLELTSPALWYLVELEGPHLHVSGATIPGLPAVIIGHNNFIAWGMTNVNANTGDLYIEPESTRIMKRTERILVKNSTPVKHIVRWSKHGPILSDVEPEMTLLGKNVAFKWTAFMANDTTLESFIKMDYAHNWSEFKDALKYYVAPVQNFVYADQKGNIGYFMPGSIPIRHGWDGSLPVEENENKEWNEFIPFEELPQMFNPKSGLIITANNKSTSDDYPYPITFRWEAPPYRAKRIVELLQRSIKNHSLSQIDMASIQLDVMNDLWVDLKPILSKTTPNDGRSRMALKMLDQWDGRMTTDSDAATIFSFWMAELNKLMPQAIYRINHRPEPLFVKQQLEENGTYCKDLAFHDCSEFLSVSLQKALSKLASTYGDNLNHWQWGRVHHANFKALGFGDISIVNRLVNKSIPTPGGYHTVNVGTYNDAFQQIDGAVYREIMDLSDLSASEFIIPLGQVDALFSDHQYDLLPIWVQGGYIRLAGVPYRQVLKLKPH